MMSVKVWTKPRTVKALITYNSTGPRMICAGFSLRNGNQIERLTAQRCLVASGVPPTGSRFARRAGDIYANVKSSFHIGINILRG